DMIKVTVAADNGEILQYDAQSYLMNHTERKLEKPELEEEEARRRLPPDFEPRGEGRLALIPTEGLREVLTYEYRGTVDETEFSIFVSGSAGQSGEVLQVVHSSEGEVAREAPGPAGEGGLRGEVVGRTPPSLPEASAR